jgi:aryl-alcohol dehydrogenase
MDIQALVARGAGALRKETLRLDEPRADEVRVRIVATGVCHTDVHVLHGGFPYPQPFVLGHEGAGIVDKVGANVRGLAPGDHVVLTFNSCGACAQCKTAHPAYCEQFGPLNFAGCRPDGAATLHNHDEVVHGSFFSQSSFATYALASARNVVKIDKAVPLELMGPLGCGVQTGAGTVLNALKPMKGQTIAVFGVGAVGLSAIMASRVVECTTVVAIDRTQSRLDLARELGATHTINVNNEDAGQALTALGGVDYAIDTTGNVNVIASALAQVKLNGALALVGAVAPDAVLPLNLLHMTLGRRIVGVIEGDSDPHTFIPYLIDLYRTGRFPFDRLVTRYAFDAIEEAVRDMEAGSAIKPVIVV